jgi:hypothetical protein
VNLTKQMDSDEDHEFSSTYDFDNYVLHDLLVWNDHNDNNLSRYLSDSEEEEEEEEEEQGADFIPSDTTHEAEEEEVELSCKVIRQNECTVQLSDGKGVSIVITRDMVCKWAAFLEEQHVNAEQQTGK